MINNTTTHGGDQVPCQTYSVNVPLFTNITIWNRFYAKSWDGKKRLISQPQSTQLAPNPLICARIHVVCSKEFLTAIEKIIPPHCAVQGFPDCATYYILWASPIDRPHSLISKAVNPTTGVEVAELQRLNDASAYACAEFKERWLNAHRLTQQQQLELILLFKRHSARNYERRSKGKGGE